MTKKNVYYSMLFLFFLACSKKEPAAPVWLNATDTITLPTDTLFFSSSIKKEWKACLLSFVQPVHLELKPGAEGFIIYLKEKTGIIEGPAQLVLQYNDISFFYPIQFRNASPGLITEKDYRSPKTVNPDSSLHQHRMLYTTDQWRNLQLLRKSTAFFAENITDLTTQTGIYPAQKNNPVTAFYVQPGSVKNIQLYASYQPSNNSYTVETGQLKDAYNNTVANGTNVVFSYWNKNIVYKMEALTINGKASVKIPAAEKGYFIAATIGQYSSPTITVSKPS